MVGTNTLHFDWYVESALNVDRGLETSAVERPNPYITGYSSPESPYGTDSGVRGPA